MAVTAFQEFARNAFVKTCFSCKIICIDCIKIISGGLFHRMCE